MAHSSPTTPVASQRLDTSPNRTTSTSTTPAPTTVVTATPNQSAYRWNGEELGASPLRKCVAVLPLVF